ncbi:MAG TPA: zf-HC2 domain-containing protein [Gaiellaceae bacterium]|nr:zf-HC2 domain-containing protein [Gaiellaceae bacterium]
MSLHLIPPSECSRARESVSCRLDGELTELEAAGLDDHLRDCADCSAYARELQALATELRSAPLERPNITVFVATRRRPLVRLQTAAAAAAVVAIAAGSSFVIGRAVGVHGVAQPPSQATVTADAFSLRADSTRQHVLAMLSSQPEPAGEVRVGRTIVL